MPVLDIDWVGFSVYASGSAYGPYVVAYHELVWIESGSATFTTEGQEHLLGPGSVVVSPPGSRNHYVWDSERPTTHGYVLFTPSPGAAPAAQVAHLEPSDVVPVLMDHIRWLDNQRPAGWGLLAGEALRYVLQALAAGTTQTMRGDQAALPPAVERALEFVRARWATDHRMLPVALAELARAGAVSPEHLCRLFRQEVGCGPIEALRALRLHRAAALLARSNLSVAEVAHECGFESPFHFSRAFKSRYGAAPRDFRKQQLLGPALSPGIRRVASHV